MIHNRLLTTRDVADYLQMSEGFVKTEIHMGNLEAVYVGYLWRIEAGALVDHIETRKVSLPLLNRRVRAVE